ncbi:MAG: S41 family peptidase [Bacteroidota bacterium]
MKHLLLFLCAFTLTTLSAQKEDGDQKFAPAQLKEDLAYIKHLLFEVQANPFSEISKPAYEQLFSGIETRLNDSLTATEFFKLVRPCTAFLSDEHARIGLSKPSKSYRSGYIFLPLSLKKVGKNYVLDTILMDDTGLIKDDIITHINKIPVEQIVQQCADYTSGFPEQRMEKAAKQLGYLYAMTTPAQESFIVTRNGNEDIKMPGAQFKTWLSFLSDQGHDDCSDLIRYTKIGETGYIDACSFGVRSDSAMEAVRQKIDGIFNQIQNDKVKNLIIDVSQNSGGNSGVGDIILDYITSKPYFGYQCNWRRSKEYLKQMDSWGSKDERYTQTKVGEILHYAPSEHKPGDNNRRFYQKVYVVVGQGTFSSAIMFATMVKDNHIATLVGQTPTNGHPNHFGELYSANTPNTGLNIQFGVKEWIRPAGKQGQNLLVPDVLLNDQDMSSAERMAKALVK